MIIYPGRIPFRTRQPPFRPTNSIRFQCPYHSVSYYLVVWFNCVINLFFKFDDIFIVPVNTALHNGEFYRCYKNNTHIIWTQTTLMKSASLTQSVSHLSNQTSFGKRGKCRNLFHNSLKLFQNEFMTNFNYSYFIPKHIVIKSATFIEDVRVIYIWPPLSIFSGHILSLLWHMFRSNTDKKLIAFS